MKWAKFIKNVMALAPSFVSAVARDPEEVRRAMAKARDESAKRELERIERIKREREDGGTD